MTGVTITPTCSVCTVRRAFTAFTHFSLDCVSSQPDCVHTKWSNHNQLRPHHQQQWFVFFSLSKTCIHSLDNRSGWRADNLHDQLSAVGLRCGRFRREPADLDCASLCARLLHADSELHLHLCAVLRLQEIVLILCRLDRCGHDSEYERQSLGAARD